MATFNDIIERGSSVNIDKVLDALKVAEASGATAVSPKGARSVYQIWEPTFNAIKKRNPDLPRITFKDLSKPENEATAREYARAVVADSVARGFTAPKDIASIYNSGKPWKHGKKIDETKAYVPRFMQAFQGDEGAAMTRAEVPEVRAAAMRSHETPKGGFLSRVWSAVGPSEALGAEQQSVFDRIISETGAASDTAWDRAMEGTRTSIVSDWSRLQREEDLRQAQEITDALREGGAIDGSKTVSEKERLTYLEQFRRGVRNPILGASFESSVGRVAGVPTSGLAELFGSVEGSAAGREAFIMGSQAARQDLGLFGKVAAGAAMIGPDLPLFGSAPVRALPPLTRLGTVMGVGEAARPGSDLESIAHRFLEGAGTELTFGAAGGLGQVAAPGSRMAQVGSQALAGLGLGAAGGGDATDATASGILGAFFGTQSKLRPGFENIPVSQRWGEVFGVTPMAERRIQALMSSGAAQAAREMGIHRQAGPPMEEVMGRVKTNYVTNPDWMDWTVTDPITEYGGSPDGPWAVERTSGRTQPPEVVRGPIGRQYTGIPIRDAGAWLNQVHFDFVKGSRDPRNAGKHYDEYWTEGRRRLIRRRTRAISTSAENSGAAPKGFADTAEAAGTKASTIGATAVEGRTVIPSGYEDAPLLPPAGKTKLDPLSITDTEILLDTAPHLVPEVNLLQSFAGNPERALGKDIEGRAIHDILDRRIDATRRGWVRDWTEILWDAVSVPRLKGVAVPRRGVLEQIVPPGKRAFEFRKLLPEKDLEMMARALDGQRAAKEYIEANPDLAQRVAKVRTMLNEIARRADLPPERFISEYFPHMMQKVEKLGDDVLLTEAKTLGDLMVDIKAQTPKNVFFGHLDKDRVRDMPEYLNWNAWDVLRIYVYGASRKIAWDTMGGPDVHAHLKNIKARLGSDNTYYKYADEYVRNYLGRNKEQHNRAMERWLAAKKKQITDKASLTAADRGALEAIKIEAARLAVKSGALETALFAPMPATRIGTQLRAIQYWSKIGANFVTPFINKTQPQVFAAPILSRTRNGKFVPGYGNTWFVRAAFWWARPDFRQVREYMVTDGALTDIPKFDVDMSLMGKLSRKTVRALGAAFVTSEMHNRGSVYAASYLKKMHDLSPDVKSGKLSKDDAVFRARQFARDLVNRTQFRGGKLSTPLGFQRPLLGLTGQFKQFGTKAAELSLPFLGTMSAGEKAQTFATLVLLAGVYGWPIVRALDPDNEWWPSAARLAGLDLSDQFGVGIFSVPRGLTDLGPFLMGPTASDAWKILKNVVGKPLETAIAPSREMEEEDWWRMQRALTSPLPGGAQINRLLNPEAEGLAQFFGPRIGAEQ